MGFTHIAQCCRLAPPSDLHSYPLTSLSVILVILLSTTFFCPKIFLFPQRSSSFLLGCTLCLEQLLTGHLQCLLLLQKSAVHLLTGRFENITFARCQLLCSWFLFVSSFKMLVTCKSISSVGPGGLKGQSPPS